MPRTAPAIAHQHVQRSFESVVVHAAWAHALSVAFDLVQKADKTTEVNPGIKEAADNSVRPFFRDMDEFTLLRLAKRAERIGDAILRRCSAKNELSRLLAVAYAIMKLVDQDPPLIERDGTLIAIAIGMVMESDDTNDEVWRDASEPKTIAKRMLEIFGEEMVKA